MAGAQWLLGATQWREVKCAAFVQPLPVAAPAYCLLQHICIAGDAEWMLAFGERIGDTAVMMVVVMVVLMMTMLDDDVECLSNSILVWGCAPGWLPHTAACACG